MYKSSKSEVADDIKIVLIQNSADVESISLNQIRQDYNTHKNKQELTTGIKISEMFNIVGEGDNAILYSINGTYSIIDKKESTNTNTIPGVLYKASFVMQDEGVVDCVVDYNYDMYLSNVDYKLYTRYKYAFIDEDENSITNDISKKIWDIYKNLKHIELDPPGLTPTEDGSTLINKGVRTYFVERVMVTLSNPSGELTQINLNTEFDSNSNVGKITIS